MTGVAPTPAQSPSTRVCPTTRTAKAQAEAVPSFATGESQTAFGVADVVVALVVSLDLCLGRTRSAHTDSLLTPSLSHPPCCVARYYEEASEEASLANGGAGDRDEDDDDAVDCGVDGVALRRARHGSLARRAGSWAAVVLRVGEGQQQQQQEGGDQAEASAIAVFTCLPSGWCHGCSGQPVKKCATSLQAEPEGTLLATIAPLVTLPPASCSSRIRWAADTADTADGGPPRATHHDHRTKYDHDNGGDDDDEMDDGALTRLEV